MKKVNRILIIFFITLIFFPSFSNSSQILPLLHHVFKVNDDVRGVLFTPYSNHLISYGDDETISLWDMQKGMLIKTFQAKSGSVNAVATDNEERFIAAGTSKGYIQIWSLEKGELLHTIKDSRKAICALVFHPNSEILVSGGKDEKIILWNVKTGTKIWEISGHEEPIHSLAFTDNGETLISASDDKTIRLWDIYTKKEKRNITETSAKWGSLNTVVVSSASDIIAVGMTEVKRAGGSRRAQVGAPVWDHLIKLRDVVTGEEICNLKGHLQEVKTVSFSKDGYFLASGSPDQTIRLWDINKQSQLTIIPQKTEVTSVAFSHDNQWIAAGGEDKKVYVWKINGLGVAPPVVVHTQLPETTDNKSEQGNIYAVIIGISKYANANISSLKYADDDAKGLYDFLISENGGNVRKENIRILLNNEATLVNMKTTLGVFLPKYAKENDTVILYYAGHGAPEVDLSGTSDDGTSKYIVPYDADPDSLYATGLPMTEIRVIFDRIEAKRVIFFVDSCYSGAAGGRTFLSQKMKTRAIRISGNFLNGLASQGSGRIIVTASRPNEQSLELDSLRHGIFTYHLLEGLKGGADVNQDKYITLKEAYDYIEGKVSGHAREMGGNQHPVMIGSFSGKIVISKTR